MLSIAPAALACLAEDSNPNSDSLKVSGFTIKLARRAFITIHANDALFIESSCVNTLFALTFFVEAHSRRAVLVF